MQPVFLLKCFFALAFVSALAHAADPTGTVAGSVTDPSGGTIVGAKVTATSLTTNLARSTVTASDGGFVFPLMPVGTYSVSVEAPGFRRFEQRGVDVRADATASVSVLMQVGSVSDTVTVEANAEMVETR